MSRRRGIAYGTGTAFMAIGVAGMLANAATTHPLGWLAWFAGAAILHDAVVAPLVLATALLVGRLPEPWRRVTRTALIPAAIVTAVAMPMVLGPGRRADVPSRLPLAYGTNLAAVLAAIGLAAAAVGILTASRPAAPARWRLITGAGLLLTGLGVLAVVVE